MFDLVQVNNKDMQETYRYGDVLLIKKALTSYHVNEVLYFEYPVKDSAEIKKTFLFQRIKGIPGDTIEIVNKIVFANGNQIEEDSAVKMNYFIETGHKPLDSLFKVRYHLTEGGEISNDFDYSYSLTKAQSLLLGQDSAIKKVELKTEKKDSFDDTCFPYSSQYSWNSDYYGKIYIPKKNDTLRLDTTNIRIYASVIRDEKNTLEIKGDSIFISGVPSQVYVAQQNYFFVLGDNRDNANDSRSWGFLSEKYIIGKVVCRIKKGKK